MPKRQNPKQHQRTYAKLVERDKDKCQDCGKTPEQLGQNLTIDHIDEDSDNWDFSNLALRCRPCNTAKSNRLRPRRKKGHSARCTSVSGDRVCVCERDYPDVNVAVVARRSAIDYGNGSSEMRANGLYEGIFRQWLIEYLEGHKSLTKKDALDSGAELTGGSPTTMQRYLDKLTSSLGPLKIAHNEAGIQVVQTKPRKET